MSSTRSNTRLRTVTTVISLAVALCVVVVALILTHTSGAQTTAWALLAPVIAIALALITKEVYSSLFIGIVIGALLYARSDPATALNTIVGKGLASAVADSAGIFIFLVILGIIVCMVNRSGGSHAFGRWAQKHIRTRVGAAIATFLLGVMIFIDDYFNCLTVGSVMRPVTDGHRISRVKLAYLIDATAAPICMIAPISSWAAAVSGCVDSETYSGLELFVRAIPYNFYSLLTIVFIVALSVMGFDYGKMAGFEIRAQGGDRGALEEDAAGNGETVNPRGSLWDLIIPIVILVVTCVCGLVYVGGFFGPNEFCEADNSGNFLAAFGATPRKYTCWSGRMSPSSQSQLFPAASALSAAVTSDSCTPRSSGIPNMASIPRSAPALSAFSAQQTTAVSPMILQRSRSARSVLSAVV